MAHPPPPQGWRVVAGGIRGVRQKVPRPQQLRGQGQAQVNAEKGLAQGGPQGTWPHCRKPGQAQGFVLHHHMGISCPVSLPEPRSSTGAQEDSTVCQGGPRRGATAPQPVLSALARTGQAVGHCMSLHSQERLCQCPIPVQVAV